MVQIKRAFLLSWTYVRRSGFYVDYRILIKVSFNNVYVKLVQI